MEYRGRYRLVVDLKTPGRSASLSMRGRIALNQKLVCLNLVHEDDRLGFEDHFRRLQAGEQADGMSLEFRFKRKDGAWRTLNLPHDWSIEGPYSEKNASGTGFLPGGIGWYRKAFRLPEPARAGKVFIEFDGVYRDSDVWINGRHL